VLNGTSSGRIVSLSGGVSGGNPVSMVLQTAIGMGFARDPVVLANGTLLASVANGPSTAQASYGGGSTGGGPGSGHYGLIGMKERATQIGANLEFVSQAGGGTTVSVLLPAGKAHAGTSLEAVK